MESNVHKKAQAAFTGWAFEGNEAADFAYCFTASMLMTRRTCLGKP